MDTGNGNFKRFESLAEAENARKDYPFTGGIFQKGEIVEIKGSRFRISQILNNGLKLSLLPKE